jgi:hypothetical protein
MNEPIACSLEAYQRVARRERWLTLASRVLVAVETTERGLRLVFAAEDGVAAELQELAELERDCCAFAAWTVRADGDRVVLAVDAEGAAVAAVQGMFGPLRKLLSA